MHLHRLDFVKYCAPLRNTVKPIRFMTIVGGFCIFSCSWGLAL